MKGIQLLQSLESLTFGGAFNQSLEGVELPRSLQSLTFGIAFNQPMEGINLPVGLQSLTMGELFRRSLPRLPKTLQRLALKGQGEHRNLSSAVAHLTSLEQISLGHGASATASLVDLPGPLIKQHGFAVSMFLKIEDSQNHGAMLGKARVNHLSFDVLYHPR